MQCRKTCLIQQRPGRLDSSKPRLHGWVLQHAGSYHRAILMSSGPGAAITVVANHSFNFDQCRRPDILRTAIATAFLCPTSTTSRLARVTPV